MKITRIKEYKKVLPTLQKRGLVVQYVKAAKTLLFGDVKSVDFKLRKPKGEKIYSFRINKKYRAFCFFDNDVLKVFDVSDHQ